MLRDAELHTTLPAPCLGALFGGGADQGGLGMLLLEVLEDRDRLAHDAAVVPLERRDMSPRIAVGVGRPAILSAEEIELDPRQVEALLQQDHAERARVRAEGVVNSHGRRWEHPGTRA